MQARKPQTKHCTNIHIKFAQWPHYSVELYRLPDNPRPTEENIPHELYLP